MDPDQYVKIVNRSRFAGLSPSAFLSISAVVVATMPVTYLLFAHGSLIALWVFVISQVVVFCQGSVIVVSCGLQRRHRELRRYGVCLILYGAVSIAMTFWFAVLATFGGPARDQMPTFLAKLWIIAVAVCIPAGIYLRRRGALVLNKPPKE